MSDKRRPSERFGISIVSINFGCVALLSMLTFVGPLFAPMFGLSAVVIGVIAFFVQRNKASRIMAPIGVALGFAPAVILIAVVAVNGS